MSTLLTDLVRKQAALSILNVFNRAVEKVAEELAHDLLRDAEFRKELQELVRVAFAQALTELHEPAPPAPERERPRY